MKTGQFNSLSQMAIEIERQNNAKRDVIMQANRIRIQSNENGSTLWSHEPSGSHCTDTATNQLATRMGIPNSYYRKLRDTAPDMLDDNMNHWLSRSYKNLMVRNLDGRTRAFLSDRYKRVDNYQIMDSVMNGLSEIGQEIQLASSDVTQNKMYLKFESPTLEGDIKVGDPVRMGVAISNSEIGTGAFTLKAMIYRLICENGMIVPKDYGESIRRTHLGSKQPLGVIYAEDTIQIEGAAMALKVRDTVKQLLSPDTFKQHLTAIQETLTHDITGNPVEAIKVLGKTVGFTENEGEGIMRHLIQGGELNRFGLIQATTAYAQDNSVNYDRASQLEELGGKILTLRPNQWNQIAQAA